MSHSLGFGSSLPARAFACRGLAAQLRRDRRSADRAAVWWSDRARAFAALGDAVGERDARLEAARYAARALDLRRMEHELGGEA